MTTSKEAQTAQSSHLQHGNVMYSSKPLRQALRVVVALLAGYILFLASLTLEPVQRHMIFMHKARWPLFAKYDIPEAYGFAPNRVRNFYVEGNNGVRLGAWHVLPQTVSNRYDLTANIPEEAFDRALRDPEHTVMLYLHGNAATRLTGHRALLARLVTAVDMDMNFVIFDYRGFADSTGHTPTEEGLVEDARTVWDWLTLHKTVPPSQIVVAGQSLGTGVAVALVGKQLSREAITPRALFLTAPFSSIRSLLLTYKLGEVVPLLQPLKYVPTLRDYLFRFLRTEFDTLSTVRDVRCPILLVHSLNDGGIASSHSRVIFDHLLDGQPEQSAAQIKTERIASFGTLRSFTRSEPRLRDQAARSPEVLHLETKYGGHNDVGYAETTLQVMKRVAQEGWVKQGESVAIGY